MLEIDNLTKSYDQDLVLNNLNLSIKQGEIYGLLGENGAGKTTTINIICGLLNYDTGTVLIDGKRISKKTKHYLGVAPQENLLYSHLDCMENLAFFGKLYGLQGKKLKIAVYQSLKAVNLLDKRNQVVSSLSGGMQKRLNVAIALIHHPKLLILDEPTTGLDISARYDMWQLILNLKRQGMTILLTTHLLDEAEKLCDRIGIIKEGKIIVEGSLNELRMIIPAQEMVFIETEEKEKLINLAKKGGINYRYYQGDLALLLPRAVELSQIINFFQGIPITSINKQSVNLQHIYLEVNQFPLTPNPSPKKRGE